MPKAVEAKELAFNAGSLSALERFGGKRGNQLLAMIAAGQVAAPIVRYLWQKRNKTDDYTITVPGSDYVYPDLHEWVLARIPEDERKAMIAASDRPAASIAYSDEPVEPSKIQLRYDGSRRQSVTLRGHKVVVAVEREHVPDRINLSENWRRELEKITFTATTPQGRDAVVEMIEGLLQAKEAGSDVPALYMPSRWGGDWTKRGDLPPRTLESTILKGGQLESLVDDVDWFLRQEAEYNRLSQPWHRGYIFHGVPGTGKTSVARSIANHFKLPTYYLPLGDIDKDTNLMQFVAAIQPRSVLLLEDIDVFHAATQRSDERGKVSVAAMLNALDGVWTPHGLITIMTTNNLAALDAALVRAGRVDVSEEFTVLDRLQAAKIAEFFGHVGFDIGPFVGKSPAELIESLNKESRSVT